MDDINQEAGKRLRFIRDIMNEGGKLSAEQFAFIVNESKDKIINYELGRTPIPVKLLNELHKRGFNPNYVISGTGELFLDNDTGINLINVLRSKANSSLISINDRAKILASLKGGEEFSKISETVASYKVAAGKLKK